MLDVKEQNVHIIYNLYLYFKYCWDANWTELPADQLKRSPTETASANESIDPVSIISFTKQQRKVSQTITKCFSYKGHIIVCFLLRWHGEILHFKRVFLFELHSAGLIYAHVIFSAVLLNLNLCAISFGFHKQQLVIQAGSSIERKAGWRCRCTCFWWHITYF